MSIPICRVPSFILILVVFSACRSGEFQELSRQQLRDKIKGGWAGQMIGVSYGAPTEFRYLGEVIPAEQLPAWRPEQVRNSLYQDDLYVDMTFARVLDEKGLEATTEDFGGMFRQARYRLWHANLAARRALKRGIPAGESGRPLYNAHANDIDFQIEADFVGLMCPGLPQASNELCWRAGRVMNSGDGIYGGMFVSGMYAAAFFQDDPRRVVEAGLACLPPESPYARVIQDVLRWAEEFPAEWTETWRRINETWDRRDPCPAGALHPFNIDAKLNGAYIALGLLYGGGDFGRTLEISTRAGQDSDCNPSNAAGILGVILGFEGIPEQWKEGIAAIEDETFDYTEFTFRTIVDSTERRALAMIEKHGGQVDSQSVRVRTQPPAPARLEVWDDYGSPSERIPVGDPRWSWKGEWQDLPGDGELRGRVSQQKGAEARVSFQGTGAMLVGPYLPSGGKAEIHLDGQLHRTVDVYPDEDRPKRREALWHVFGLDHSTHEVRIVVLGEPYGGSTGSEIQLEDLVVFR